MIRLGEVLRAKSKALVNMLIVYSNKKQNCVMLNGDGNENGKKINRSKGTVKRATKNVQLLLQHCPETSSTAM